MVHKKCAYCGSIVKKPDREHVFPKCLYPPSKAGSTVQRLTVPSCNACNNGWADDEAHFRNMLIIAGETTAVVTELWQTTMARSFTQIDGPKRARDLIAQMRPTMTASGRRYMVFPGQDERVIRVIRKIVRGLSYYHRLPTPIRDEQIWADVMQYEVPKHFLDEMEHFHREADIAKYSFQVLNEPNISSAWLITFYERRTFIAIVSPAGVNLDRRPTSLAPDPP